MAHVDYDKNRLEQELIYYIEKLDINEEKQRLSNHLRYFRETTYFSTIPYKTVTSVLGEGGWRGSTREERWGHYFLRRKNLRIKEVLDKNIW